MSVIVTVTINPAVDKSATVDVVTPEHKLRCGAPRFDPGGGGLNVSRALKRLGSESLAIYPAGGLTGQMLAQLLDEEGIGQVVVSTSGLTRENFHVIEQSTGHQFRFTLPGPELSEKEWQRILEAIETLDPKPDYIVASGSIPAGAPVDIFARIAVIGRQLGARVVVDTSKEALAAAVREPVFLIKPNAAELAQLAGTNNETEPAMQANALRILDEGKCEAVVVSLGPAGAMLVTVDGVSRFRPPAIRSISRIGAGDSMVAGIVHHLSQGGALPDAVRYGVAAGTAACMGYGTQLCQREDVERVLAEMET